MITAGALFRVFGHGYHDGGEARPESLPTGLPGQTLGQEYIAQLQATYRAGYRLGAAARSDGRYGADHGDAWRHYLNTLPLP